MSESYEEENDNRSSYLVFVEMQPCKHPFPAVIEFLGDDYQTIEVPHKCCVCQCPQMYFELMDSDYEAVVAALTGEQRGRFKVAAKAALNQIYGDTYRGES